MGYTHYWYRKQGVGTRQQFQALGTDAKRIIAQAEADGIAVGNWDGEGSPEFTELRFALNGVGEQAHETFAWEDSVYVQEWQRQFAASTGEDATEAFACCKTAYKPYDAVVTAILVRAKEIYGDALRVSSDGTWAEWQAGRDLYRRTFGKEAPMPFDNADEYA